MFKFFILVISLAVISNGANAGETRKSSKSVQGPQLKTGDCILSVRHLYLRVYSDGSTPVIPLKKAMEENSGCRKLRDYKEVEDAYAELSPLAHASDPWNYCPLENSKKFYRCGHFRSLEERFASDQKELLKTQEDLKNQQMLYMQTLFGR